MHGYQECLEKVYALQPLLDSSFQSAEHPQSLHQRKYASELQQALTAAGAIESKHRVRPRWTASCEEYQTAASERKLYHIGQLQRKIVAHLDWLRWAQLTISRTPRQHRGTSSQLHKQRRQARTRLQQAVKQLQDWHAVLDDHDSLHYDAASLNAEEMESTSWVIPWEHSSTLAGSIAEQKTETEQRIMRCNEELLIVVRESKDMVLYYDQLVASLRSAIDIRQPHAAGLGTMLNAAAVEVMQAYSPLDRDSIQQQYTQGQVHMLQEKLLRSEQLLHRAKELLSRLTHDDVPAPEMQAVAGATSGSDNTSSHQQSAQHIDLAETDVADFLDLLAAEAAMSEVSLAEADDLPEFLDTGNVSL